MNNQKPLSCFVDTLQKTECDLLVIFFFLNCNFSFQDGNSCGMKTPELPQWCAQDRLYWDDMTGNWCCFSAATEESTACTTSHVIKEPTNTQMYKHRRFVTVFLATWSFLHYLLFFLYFATTCFFSDWLQLFEQFKQCEINPMFHQPNSYSSANTVHVI